MSTYDSGIAFMDGLALCFVACMLAASAHGWNAELLRIRARLGITLRPCGRFLRTILPSIFFVAGWALVCLGVVGLV